MDDVSVGPMIPFEVPFVVLVLIPNGFVADDELTPSEFVVAGEADEQLVVVELLEIVLLLLVLEFAEAAAATAAAFNICCRW